ncbi:MAG: hypothetical protein GY758_33730, partial [Fuerstiella sp.]|nr:hypothetical protein [Fuerstiella sp.]
MNNVVGKMLIVMQLMFSILFMCFAGAVYTFQGQWKKQAAVMEGKWQNAEQQTTAAKDAHTADITTLTDRAKEAEVERDNAVAKLDGAIAKEQSTQGDLDKVSLERDKAIADTQVASAEGASRVVESNALNKEVQSLRERIAELRQELQVMEDSLLDGQGKLAGAEEMEEQLLTEVASLKDLLRLNEIDPRTQITPGDVPDQIEKVDGFVEDTRRNQTRTQELVQLTIGSDDKVYKDMTLTVYRKDDYVCQVRVMDVYPDKAICVVNEKTRRRLVQVGDNVTTKL